MLAQLCRPEPRSPPTWTTCSHPPSEPSGPAEGGQGGQGAVQPRRAPLLPLWGRRLRLSLGRSGREGGRVLQGVLAAAGTGQCGAGVQGAQAQPPGLALHWGKAAFSS